MFALTLLITTVCPAMQADFKLIKKRIEDLMQREYLERDRDNPNMIRYLA